LGIGLSIVRRLVELHGGTATASSPGPDRGATFTIYLPHQVAKGYRTQSVLASASPATVADA
jgi:signal transduction histidine kinase